MQPVLYRPSPRDFLNTFFKRKRMMIVIFCAIVGAVTFYSVTVTPRYESNASMLLKFGREYAYRPEVGTSQPPVELNREDLVNSEIQILASQELAHGVVSRIGEQTLYPGIGEPPEPFTIGALRQSVRQLLDAFHEQSPEPADNALQLAVIKFRGELKIDAVPKSMVVNVAFRHPDAAIAAQAVNTLLELFKEKRLAVFSDPKSQFLEAQLEHYVKQLSEGEAKLEAYRQEFAVYDLQQQKQLLLTQRNALETELNATENQASEEARRLTSLRNQLKQVDPTVNLASETQRYPVVDDANSQLLSLRLREQQLLAKYHEASPFVQDVRGEISLVQNFLQKAQREVATRTQTGKNIVYDQIHLAVTTSEASRNALEAKHATIAEQLTRIDEEIRTLDLRERELQQLQRDVENYTANYKTYVTKVEEARIEEQMDERKMVNVSVIEPATMALRPITPQKLLNIALAVLFGSGMAVSAALGAEYFRSGFSGPEAAARALDMRLLGSIPYRTV